MINYDKYPEKDESVWADDPDELTSSQEDLVLAGGREE